ncbi:MAG: hypothetical protein K1X36_00320 [Pyrinomonadaceae bacterium]|nr:hypothetical protein [Pyrinomonadaceae bacterium]
MKKILVLAAVLLLASVAMFADIARPGTKKPSPVPKPGTNTVAKMTITLDENVSQPTLNIPRSSLKYLRGALDETGTDQDNTAVVTAPTFSRTQTFISGMFLSLAIVFGGFWFVRSGKAATKQGKAMVIVAILAGIGSAATYVYGDIALPRRDEINSRLFNMDKTAEGCCSATSDMIQIKVSNGDGVVLQIPKVDKTGEQAR